MSWAEWQGEVWETSAAEAELRVQVWPPEAGCPRATWSLLLFHHVMEGTDPATRKTLRWFHFELSDLGFRGQDWRLFSNREIKGDAAWHEAQEHTGEYGHLDTAKLNFRPVDLRLPREQRDGSQDHNWYGHAFLVRLGARDGLTFPCEIEAWLEHASEYHRRTPESAEELAFPRTPPNLRIIASATFSGGTICVPRCHGDPLPLARKFLREETGCTEMVAPEVEWTVRRSPDNQKSERRPGWASTVRFHTRPPLETG